MAIEEILNGLIISSMVVSHYVNKSHLPSTYTSFSDFSASRVILSQVEGEWVVKWKLLYDLSSESWQTGTVVLSWDKVLHGALDAEDGQNVVLHEFAHQLDQEDGVPDGTPMVEKSFRYISWARILSKEFRLLQKKAQTQN